MNVNAYIGRLVNDIELKQTPNGTKVCNFTIAVERPYTTNGEKQADYIDCVAYRHTAEFASRYFKKGVRMGVNGAMQTRTYKDKDTGKNRKVFEVIVANVYFADGKAGAAGAAADNYNSFDNSFGDENWQPIASDDFDLPFGN